MNKFFIILCFVFLISNVFAIKNQSYLAYPDYFAINEDVILVRFNQLDLPIEKDIINFKIFCLLNSSDTAKENLLHIVFINPSNARKYSVASKFEITKTKDGKLNGLISIEVPTFVFDEDNNILVKIIREKDGIELQINEENVFFDGVDSSYEEKFTGTSGVVFPTADIDKKTILDWNPFLYDKDRFGVNAFTFQMFEDPTKKTFNETYLFADFKYKIYSENGQRPAVSCGLMMGEGIQNRSSLKNKNNANLYIVASKNLSSMKIVNASLGLLNGDVLSIFAFDKEKHEKIELQTSSVVFTNIFLRIAPNAGLKFEAGYDILKNYSVFLFSISESIFDNRLSFELGTSFANIAKNHNNRLFFSIRFRV